MKIKELFERVDKSEKNSTSVDIDEFEYELLESQTIGWSEEFNKRVKGYWIQNWLCTDTWVGFIVYFFDDKPLACSFQSARKSSTEYEFYSKEIALELREFLLNLKNEDRPNFSLADLDQDIGDDYSVAYKEQILSREGFVDGEKVKVIPERGNYSEPLEEWSRINVEFPNGEIKRVELTDLKLPFHLLEK